MSPRTSSRREFASLVRVGLDFGGSGNNARKLSRARVHHEITHLSGAESFHLTDDGFLILHFASRPGARPEDVEGAVFTATANAVETLRYNEAVAPTDPRRRGPRTTVVVALAREVDAATARAE